MAKQVAEQSPEGSKEPELETVNSMKALWARPQSEVTEEEYAEFYKHVSHDWNDPLETIQMQAEGTFEYQALLFLPRQAPMDLFMRERKRGVQLYVKRVFIMDDCEELMPEYLRFVKGVVDAQDLSLNVSREILQQDRQIQLMRRRLVKKILSTVKSMMTENPENYEIFWREFGRAVKEGLLGDSENRDSILDIASFHSTNDQEKQTTLRDYVERMKDGQQHIYYMTGESRATIENSPHMEAFRAKGYEVLILTDPIDEIWVDAVPGFDGKQFQSIAKGQVDLDTEEEKKTAEAEREQQRKDFAALLTWLSAALERAGQGGPAVVTADHLRRLPRRRRARPHPDAGEDVPGDGPGTAADQAHPGAEPDASAGARPARGVRPGRRAARARRDRGTALRHGAAGRGRRAGRPVAVRDAARRPPPAVALGTHRVTRAAGFPAARFRALI